MVFCTPNNLRSKYRPCFYAIALFYLYLHISKKKQRKSPIKYWRKAKEKKENPDQRLEESKEKEKFSIKDRKKEKAKYTERSLDQEMSE